MASGTNTFIEQRRATLSKTSRAQKLTLIFLNGAFLIGSEWK